jgi:hypothetical protein
MVPQHLTYLPWAGLVTLYGSKAKGIINLKNVRFEVLTTASMKMAVFWVVAPCRSLPTADTMVTEFCRGPNIWGYIELPCTGIRVKTSAVTEAK